MKAKTIDAALMSKMFLAGARNLEAKKEWINELNVFPVPDGDTGTNMTLTIMSAVREVSSLETLNMDSFARAVSSGSLRGARGNSGVILSQLLRGFTHGIREDDEITPAVMASAFQKAVETAYKAVMKPKEGTILTVAKAGADYACDLLEENPDITLEEMLPAVLQRCEETLEMTPQMLPVLKEAGVVDSGGQGLVEVLTGALDAFNGKEIETNFESEVSDYPAARDVPSDRPVGAAMDADIKFGYCTEFIIMLDVEFTEEMEQDFKQYLSSIGDSLVVVADDDMVKVHVHTNDPGLAIQRALTYGSLTKMKIDNMREEHNERVINDEDRRRAAMEENAKNGAAPESEMPALSDEELKDTGFVCVSSGEGFAKIFSDLGADCLIEGGQTMNPSTEDMLNAIAKVPASNIFILPNNKNIILAANQAKEMTENKTVFVIPTTTVPQGITAIINYVPEKSPEENAREMEKEACAVLTGEVTYAIRDTHFEDKEIDAGDIMGVGDQDILSVGKDIEEVALLMVNKMMFQDAELISIYYGEDMSEEEAQKFADSLSGTYPQCDVEVNYGGQPIYYYIVSVE